MDTSKTNNHSINDVVLKDTTLLYLEDEELLLNEITEIFSGFFKEVIPALNGKEGLQRYAQRKDDIDIIITDINMPYMNGIDFMAEIRKNDAQIPILICTAFNETEKIIRAIKLKVTDYILKPVQMSTTLHVISKIMTEKQNSLLLKKNKKELEQYREILNHDNLILETDIEGKITFVNDLYCEVSGYDKEELIGQTNSIIKHPDTSKVLAEQLWSTIKAGNIWRGKLKNKAKDGSTYIVKHSIIPIFDKNNELEKYVATGFVITSEEEERATLKKYIMKQKSDNIRKEQNFQQRLEVKVQEAIEQTKYEIKSEQSNLVSIINELDKEIKYLRSKHADDCGRTTAVENKLKDANMKMEQLQGSYQNKLDELTQSARRANIRSEEIKVKYYALETKFKESQESVHKQQQHIEDYRAKINNLEDVILDYETKYPPEENEPEI